MKQNIARSLELILQENKRPNNDKDSEILDYFGFNKIKKGCTSNGIKYRRFQVKRSAERAILRALKLISIDN